MKHNYSASQIQGAYVMANNFGYKCPSDEIAVEFLNLFHNAKNYNVEMAAEFWKKLGV